MWGTVRGIVRDATMWCAIRAAYIVSLGDRVVWVVSQAPCWLALLKGVQILFRLLVFSVGRVTRCVPHHAGSRALVHTDIE